MFKKLFYTDLQSPNVERVQGDKEVKVEWMHSDYRKLFVAYTIERSENGKDFVLKKAGVGKMSIGGPTRKPAC